MLLYVYIHMEVDHFTNIWLYQYTKVIPWGVVIVRGLGSDIYVQNFPVNQIACDAWKNMQLLKPILYNIIQISYRFLYFFEWNRNIFNCSIFIHTSCILLHAGDENHPRMSFRIPIVDEWGAVRRGWSRRCTAMRISDVAIVAVSGDAAAVNGIICSQFWSAP